MSPIRLIACCAFMLATTLPALGQPAAASAPWPAASGAGARGPGCGGPGVRWGRADTPGWSMMTPDERQAHHDRMAGFKSYEECRAYMDEHHKDMQARAKERGVKAPAVPRRDACAGLKPAANK